MFVYPSIIAQQDKLTAYMLFLNFIALKLSIYYI